MSSRVVITGIGVVSSIGGTREQFWRSCLEGRSGVAPLDTPWVAETGLATRIAANVDDFDPARAGLESKQTRVLDINTQYCVAAAAEALADSDLVLESGDRQGSFRIRDIEGSRVACIVGSGIGGLASFETFHGDWHRERSKKKLKRYALPMLIPNAPAAQVAIRFGARGECKAISTACAAGTMALGDAWRALAAGEADVAVAGGADAVAGDVDAFGMMGFDRLQTLSTRNDEPERASRPFDRDRDGFVLGEGAAILILERQEHAAARGASAYAEVAGYATNCDAHSMMQLDESGESIVELLRSALKVAGISRSDVDHVSAHATSTRLNDLTEARALRAFFGERTDDIPVTGLKSMTGHAIAASGPMEAAAAAMSIREGVLTPTINYDTPDPECDVNVVANRPLERRVDTCLKLSYGFGGHNACLVLRRT